MQKSGEEATPQGPSVNFPIPAALSEGDHSTDLVFTVEGHPLHFPKAVLTLCSPVFAALLTPEYVQQHSEGIPLEGKKYSSVAFFFMQLHPVFSAVTPMTDDMLLETLELANEFKVDHLSTKCEQFIGSQMELLVAKKTLTADTILHYLNVCERCHLAKHRAKLVKLAANQSTTSLQGSLLREALPVDTMKDVFLVRSQTLEGNLLSLKQQITSQLQDTKMYLNGGIEFNKTMKDMVSDMKHVIKEINRLIQLLH